MGAGTWGDSVSSCGLCVGGGGGAGQRREELQGQLNYTHLVSPKCDIVDFVTPFATFACDLETVSRLLNLI